MTELALNKKLWNESIAEFIKLYDKKPSTPKDWSRVTHIYSSFGGTFSNQESIIPDSIKESLMKEGILNEVKNALSKLFKNPVILGIALYFISNLWKKHK